MWETSNSMLVIFWTREIKCLMFWRDFVASISFPLTCIHLLLCHASRNGVELDVRTSLNSRALEAIPCRWQTMQTPAVVPQVHRSASIPHQPELNIHHYTTCRVIHQHHKKRETVCHLEAVPSRCTRRCLRPTPRRTASRLRWRVGPSSFKAGVRNNAVWLLHAKI